MSNSTDPAAYLAAHGAHPAAIAAILAGLPGVTVAELAAAHQRPSIRDLYAYAFIDWTNAHAFRAPIPPAQPFEARADALRAALTASGAAEATIAHKIAAFAIADYVLSIHLDATRTFALDALTRTFQGLPAGAAPTPPPARPGQSGIARWSAPCPDRSGNN